MLDYQKNVSMWEASLLKLDDPSVPHHFTQHVLFQQLFKQHSELDLEDASNYARAVGSNFSVFVRARLS